MFDYITRQTYFACRIATKLFSLQHMTGQTSTRLLIKRGHLKKWKTRGESYKIQKDIFCVSRWLTAWFMSATT